MGNIKINKDERGHYGQLFGNNKGRHICVCPVCCASYASDFMQGKPPFQDDGFDSKEEAIDFWNKNHPSEV